MDLQEVAPSVANVTPPHEAAAARMKHCNIKAVILHVLPAGGGGGPVFVID